MKIISVRETPEYKDKAIGYFQSKWSVLPVIYEDSINHSLTTENPLPQWYLLEKENEIIGCAGLITNDFISRMDLYPWICGVYIEENYRGNAYASLLLERAKIDAAKAGFNNVYLSTDHIGFYEKYGFSYLGQGYHPWGEESRIYGINLNGMMEKLSIIIREETAGDYPEIYRLIRTAFKTANVKDGDEQDYVVNLRESDKYIPQLTLVAETGSRLIGHIMLTRFKVTKSDGTGFEALLVAALSVLLEYRNKGVGAELLKQSFRIASQLGFKAAFLIGDPAYYQRFGFVSTTVFNIRNVNDIPQQFAMVRILEPGALDSVEGMIDFH